MQQKGVSTCVFGASPGTGNQGVNALCWSTLTGLAERGCTDLHVFDYGRRTRPAATPSYGTDTLEAFFKKVSVEGLAGQELGDQAVFKSKD